MISSSNQIQQFWFSCILSNKKTIGCLLVFLYQISVIDWYKKLYFLVWLTLTDVQYRCTLWQQGLVQHNTRQTSPCKGWGPLEGQLFAFNVTVLQYLFYNFCENKNKNLYCLSPQQFKTKNSKFSSHLNNLSPLSLLFSILKRSNLGRVCDSLIRKMCPTSHHCSCVFAPCSLTSELTVHDVRESSLSRYWAVSVAIIAVFFSFPSLCCLFQRGFK